MNIVQSNLRIDALIEFVNIRNIDDEYSTPKEPRQLTAFKLDANGYNLSLEQVVEQPTATRLFV